MLTGFINDVYDSVSNKIHTYKWNRLQSKMKSIVKKEYGHCPELFDKYYETGLADKLIDWILKTSAYDSSNNDIIYKFKKYNDYFINDISQLPDCYISIIKPEYFTESKIYSDEYSRLLSLSQNIEQFDYIDNLRYNGKRFSSIEVNNYLAISINNPTEIINTIWVSMLIQGVLGLDNKINDYNADYMMYYNFDYMMYLKNIIGNANKNHVSIDEIADELSLINSNGITDDDKVNAIVDYMQASASYDYEHLKSLISHNELFSHMQPINTVIILVMMKEFIEKLIERHTEITHNKPIEFNDYKIILTMLHGDMKNDITNIMRSINANDYNELKEYPSEFIIQSMLSLY